jgi:aspartyl-tRNA(Asn)/glutamyl-tRNA(Gln) amidotransferase subunit C
MSTDPPRHQRIANLARLELMPESERMLTQLNGFFDIVQQMRAVDTTGIEPLAHPVATIRTWPCACATTW